MAERFENLENILRDWAKDKVRSIVEALNWYEKQEEERNSRFLFQKMTLKNTQAVWSLSVSLVSRAITKPNKKLVKLCLEFNKSNEQTAYDNNLLKIFKFYQNNC